MAAKWPWHGCMQLFDIYMFILSRTACWCFSFVFLGLPKIGPNYLRLKTPSGTISNSWLRCYRRIINNDDSESFGRLQFQLFVENEVEIERLFKVTGNHVHGEVVVSQKWCKIDTLLLLLLLLLPTKNLNEEYVNFENALRFNLADYKYDFLMLGTRCNSCMDILAISPC